jgi:hypothetical protein
MDATSEAGTGYTFRNLWRHYYDVISDVSSVVFCGIFFVVFIFFFFFFTIIYFYSSLPANNAPWSSRFSQGSLFYNKG